jgi:hypothetical protein
MRVLTDRARDCEEYRWASVRQACADVEHRET